MKHPLFSAALALSLALPGTLMLAQQAQPADPPQQTAPNVQQPPHHHFHHPNPERETARLTRKLNLSPDQSAKLEPILADRDQKMATLWSNQNLTPQDRHEQMHALHQSTDQQLASVLTPDQMQQMKAMHHGHRGSRQGSDGTNPAPPAAS